MIDIQKLIDSNDLWKKQEMEDLQDLVQSRIYHVQVCVFTSVSSQLTTFIIKIFITVLINFFVIFWTKYNMQLAANND